MSDQTITGFLIIGGTFLFLFVALWFSDRNSRNDDYCQWR